MPQSKIPRGAGVRTGDEALTRFQTHYQFKDKGVERLLGSALRESWNVYTDLPWNTPVTPEDLVKNSRSLVENLPGFKKLSEPQKKELKLKEAIYHISNLLAGEHKGVSLAAQILVGCPQDCPDWAYFVSTIIADERNHVLALTAYLQDKIGICYAPHPRIESVLNALLKEDSIQVKLFISQVVLEWTATALLSAMLSKRPEPLFNQILNRIIRDEGRHLMFNRLIHKESTGVEFDAPKKAIEDLLFESIVACISSLCAIPVWQEYGFPIETCREYALKEMQDRGVFHFYQNILPKELTRCRFQSERLSTLLKNELPRQIIQDHWTFEPKGEPKGETREIRRKSA